jgi:hypothetical protein
MPPDKSHKETLVLLLIAVWQHQLQDIEARSYHESTEQDSTKIGSHARIIQPLQILSLYVSVWMRPNWNFHRSSLACVLLQTHITSSSESGPNYGPHTDSWGQPGSASSDRVSRVPWLWIAQCNCGRNSLPLMSPSWAWAREWLRVSEWLGVSEWGREVGGMETRLPQRALAS